MITKFIGYIIIMSLIASNCLADAVIFSGSDVKALKPSLDLFGNGKVQSGSADPTSSAQNAPAGSLYLSTSTKSAYVKQDAGSTTNWTLLGTSASPLYAQGVFSSSDCSWSRSSSTLGLPAVDTSCTFTANAANTISISAYNDGTAGHQYPGITFTASGKAYFACASGTMSGQTDGYVDILLTDGTANIDMSETYQTSGHDFGYQLCGIYKPAAGSVNLYLAIASFSGAQVLFPNSQNTGITQAIAFKIVEIH